MNEQVDIKAIRKAARQYANQEADAIVDLWPAYCASRRVIESVIAEHVGLPWEHRRRVYYKHALLAAMNAYDSAMAARQRRLAKQRERVHAWAASSMARAQEGRR